MISQPVYDLSQMSIGPYEFFHPSISHFSKNSQEPYQFLYPSEESVVRRFQNFSPSLHSACGPCCGSLKSQKKGLGKPFSYTWPPLYYQSFGRSLVGRHQQNATELANDSGLDRELEPNRKLFHNYLSSILEAALVGSGFRLVNTGTGE
jgi:hypothetical protein